MKISYRNFITKNPLRVKRKKYYKNKKLNDSGSAMIFESLGSGSLFFGNFCENFGRGPCTEYKNFSYRLT